MLKLRRTGGPSEGLWSPGGGHLHVVLEVFGLDRMRRRHCRLSLSRKADLRFHGGDECFRSSLEWSSAFSGGNID